MKLTPIAVLRTRTSPGPGFDTSTFSHFRTSGPPVWWKRVACAIFVTPSRVVVVAAVLRRRFAHYRSPPVVPAAAARCSRAARDHAELDRDPHVEDADALRAQEVEQALRVLVAHR